MATLLVPLVIWYMALKPTAVLKSALLKVPVIGFCPNIIELVKLVVLDEASFKPLIKETPEALVKLKVPEPSVVIT